MNKLIQKLIIYSSLSFVIIICSFVFIVRHAEAHANGPPTAAAFQASCDTVYANTNNTKAASFAAWASTASSTIYVAQGTSFILTTLNFRAHMCYDEFGNVITGNNNRFVILQPKDSRYGGLANLYVNRNLTTPDETTDSPLVSVDTSAMGVGNHQVCFDWQGQTDGFVSTPIQTFCLNITVTTAPPPPQGTLTSTKYYSVNTQNNASTVCFNTTNDVALKCDFLSQVVTSQPGGMYKLSSNSPAAWGEKLVGFRMNYYSPSNLLSTCHSGYNGWGGVDINILGTNGIGPYCGLYTSFASDGSGNFSLFPLASGKNTFIDLWYDVNPNGNVESGLCDSNNEKVVIEGWALDRSKPTEKIQIAVYDGAPGTLVGTYDANISTGRPDSFANIPVNGHVFKAELPPNLYNGTNHTYYVYALGINPDGTRNNANPLIGSGGRAIICTPQTRYYPWLQTKAGDVVAQNKVIGQEFDSPVGSHLGGRTNTINGAELDYLLISLADNGQTHNFCSNNQYVPGGLVPLKQCSAGGYAFNHPSAEDLAKLQNAVHNAYTKNGSGGGGNCLPYKTANLPLANGDVSPGCANGTVYKTNGTNLSNITQGTGDFSVSQGRATIWVTGNLTIDKNIIAAASAPNGQTLPNLALFVEGDVIINPNVTRVDAIIIATGRIKSCSVYPNALCQNQLQVRGYWASPVGMQFGRNYFNTSSPNFSPAEQFILTGQSVVYPPPGLSRSDSDIDSQLKFDAGELPPRLN